MSCCVSRKDIVVLGVGNPLMSDEGIGPAVVGWFYRHVQEYPFADFIDVGTGGMSVLHMIANRRKAVFIDCAYMGTEAGTIRRFGPDEIKSVKKLAHQSLHEADILNIISMSEKLNQRPQTIVFFGIEPEKVEPGQVLSKTLSAKMDDYIAAVRQELTVPNLNGL